MPPTPQSVKFSARALFTSLTVPIEWDNVEQKPVGASQFLVPFDVSARTPGVQGHGRAVVEGDGLGAVIYELVV